MISSISVVIPFYNEQGNILPLIEEIDLALKNLSAFEVILVNDGSKDQTAQDIEAACRLYSNSTARHHITNQGQSAALMTGIQSAKYDWIVTLDGDGQNNPHDITELIQALPTTGQHVAFGNRQHRQDSWLKKISSRLANYIRILVLDDRCLDTGCSLKLFPKSAFLNLPKFNHMHRFLPALFQFSGYRVVNFPVSHRPRIRGTSKYGFWSRLRAGIFDLIGVLWLKNRYLRSALLTEPQSIGNASISVQQNKKA